MLKPPLNLGDIGIARESVRCRCGPVGNPSLNRRIEKYSSIIRDVALNERVGYVPVYEEIAAKIGFAGPRIHLFSVLAILSRCLPRHHSA
jgi:hypothetical protein